jgi:hypothetical protein
MGEGIRAVQLSDEPVRSPYGDAQPSIAHRHCFAGSGIWLAQYDVGSAYQASGIDDEMPGLPRGRRMPFPTLSGRIRSNGSGNSDQDNQ